MLAAPGRNIRRRSEFLAGKEDPLGRMFPNWAGGMLHP